MEIQVDIPDGKSGDWKISTFTVTKQDADMFNLRAMFSFSHKGRPIKAGTYKRLTYYNRTVMSNTPAEIHDHIQFIRIAKGGSKILINGLGLGVALIEIMKSKDIISITIIEKSKDVIKLVAPFFDNDKRIHIINADAFTWNPPKGIRYNVVWHDIWTDLCKDNLSERTKLKRKYGRRCDWQGCWAEKEIKRMKM